MTTQLALDFTVVYDRALLAEIARSRHPHSRRIRIRDVVFGFVLSLLVTALALAVSHEIGGRAAVRGLAVGAAAFWLGTLIYRRFWVPHWFAEMQLSEEFDVGPAQIMLRPAGLRFATRHAEMVLDWNAVNGVSTYSGGLLLWTGIVAAIPLPDAALPEGLDRETMLARIEAWRRAGER